MRVLQLGAVLVGLSGPACAQSPSASDDPVELFRAACLDTNMERESLEVFARERGWAPIPFNSGPGGPAWGVGFGNGETRVMLIDWGETGRSSPLPVRRECQLDRRSDGVDRGSTVGQLATSLGLDAQLPPQGVQAGGRFIWGTGDVAITYQPSTGDGRLVLKVMRGIVQLPTG
jgi:hypothetical protein